ncbi:MAG: CAP domain-containing protein [Candidatus Shapirobacteria bacterium]|nr:CAP domain-containing protein [Candidatus Shapirobacteria bacterium]
MKSKIGWVVIIVELGLIAILTTKYWKEINGFVDLLISPKIIEIKLNSEPQKRDEEIESTKETPSRVMTPTPKIKIITPTIIKKKIYPTPTDDDTPWGVARQVGEVTWTMKIGEDEKMATAKEIWNALNNYRQTHGSQILNWDTKLADYAQNRAVYLSSIKNVDEHKGFSDFLNNENGFDKLGFTALGENISYGYKLNGVHTIEWMYAGDKPHNDNQLDNKWNYVGIGVDGLATCLIFGTGKF